MPEISQSFMAGAGLGAQMQAQATNARLALRGQLLQEEGMRLREREFEFQQAQELRRNRFMDAQTRLMESRADIEAATKEYAITKAAKDADQARQAVDLATRLEALRPQYGKLFQQELTEATTRWAAKEPYVPGKHISAFLAANGGANSLALADDAFTDMQKQLNTVVDQHVKANPDISDIQSNWAFYQNLKRSDPKQAEEFKATMLDKSTETMEFDATTGRMVVTKGPSPAQTGKVTEQAAGAVNMGQLINNVLPKVNTATVGLGGALGRVIDSTLVSDVFPQLFKRDRAEVYQQLGILRAEATKLLRTDTQIAEGERKAIERLLPQVSAASSVQLVQQQLLDIRSHIGRGRRTMLERFKQPIPPEFWKQEEVVAEAKRRDEAGEFPDYAAKMKWVNDAMLRTLYPNKYNTDLATMKRYAPRD